jgi:hypothetical protein
MESSSAHIMLPDLWRGMNVSLNDADAFWKDGGTDYAPQSTSTELKVALSYSNFNVPGATPVLLRIRNQGWKQKEGWQNYGVDIGFLSCFPAENERVYPPLTFLKPIHEQPERVHVTIAGEGYGEGSSMFEKRSVTITVVSVKAEFSN